MSNRQQTVLTPDGGLGADLAGDWHRVTVPKLILSVYDADAFASGVVVEFDLSDDPVTDPPADPVNFAPMYDDAGSIVQIGIKRADIPLVFVAKYYRMRARTVGGDGNTKILSRLNF